MREIVLDTETTGLSPQDGHRLVEIGCLELFNHVATGKFFHAYLDPERDMPEGALKIHGLTTDFLRGQPKFADKADEFLEFIGEDQLVIHNASFDMGFINAELKRIGRAALPMARAIDTLDIARRKFPGAQNNLDALCRRFDIDNSAREKHGALLDSELLAEVYLELMGGRQPGLVLQADIEAARSPGADTAKVQAQARPAPLPPRLTDAEREAHEAFVAGLRGEALWNAAKS
ncbi:DNA polymerase III subunit epsilon [Parvibaculum sp.]|uniref:DNA polymerase III subunit epsilon n=1 Tax=Parvibaculum sp. TaxID=2024848 RepID=UPI001DF6D17D|nr:DNA polymerase III subunit epsilon [Parvibaculum sp.]MBX3489745.1 DNA polymerase III subunit epsilon [Parvibaculum sp.]MCW5726297.1 DNA polymerase III subunit epsilon [Parvibaculum sp.]